MAISGRLCHSQPLFAVALFISTWFYIAGFSEFRNGFSTRRYLLKMETITRKVVVNHESVWAFTGGPEALCQLAIAFQSLGVPTRVTNSRGWEKGVDARFKELYPALETLQIIGTDELTAGDIYIIPEIHSCPEELVQKGVHVYIWLLGEKKNIQNSLSQGCRVLSHNFWLTHENGINLDATFVLRPYITPRLIPNTTVTNQMRENIVLIDSDERRSIQKTLKSYCAQSPNCNEAILVRGFTRDELLNLYKRAKVIVDVCMRGSERIPIEAMLHGAVLLSSDCQTAQEFRDFPIPFRNIVEQGTLGAAVDRIFADFEHEQAEYSTVRELYSTLSHETLREEARNFLAFVWPTASFDTYTS